MCKLCCAKEVDQEVDFHQTEQGPMANLGVEGLDRLHDVIEEKSEGEIKRRKETTGALQKALKLWGGGGI